MGDPFTVHFSSNIAVVRCDFRTKVHLATSGGSWIQMWDMINTDCMTLSVACLAMLGGSPELSLSPVGPKTAGMKKPFVLGVDGYVSGPVHELLAQADVVIASDSSTVGPPSTILSDPGSPVVRGVPHQELARLLLLESAEAMSLERSQQLGLVDDVVTSDRLEIATIDRARRLVLD